MDQAKLLLQLSQVETLQGQGPGQPEPVVDQVRGAGHSSKSTLVRGLLAMQGQAQVGHVGAEVGWVEGQGAEVADGW